MNGLCSEYRGFVEDELRTQKALGQGEISPFQKLCTLVSCGFFGFCSDNFARLSVHIFPNKLSSFGIRAISEWDTSRDLRPIAVTSCRLHMARTRNSATRDAKVYLIVQCRCVTEVYVSHICTAHSPGHILREWDVYHIAHRTSERLS